MNLKSKIAATTLFFFWGITATMFDFQPEKQIQAPLTYSLNRKWLDSNLARIMQMQEVKLRIKHYKTPDIFLAADGDKEAMRLKKKFPEAAAYYNQFENKIYIFMGNELKTGMIKELAFEGLLGHELGHYYTDKLSETLTGRDFPNKYGFSRKFVGQALISEGIAACFEESVLEDNFETETYQKPKYIRDIEEKDWYSAGYDMVCPIVWQYSQPGIEYLIKDENIPRDNETFDASKYQAKAMMELAKQSQAKNNK